MKPPRRPEKRPSRPPAPSRPPTPPPRRPPPPPPSRGDGEAASERLVYGLHAVAEVLRSRHADVRGLLIAQELGADRGSISGILSMAAGRGLDPRERPRAELDRLTRSGVHQGVVALCGPYRYASGVGELCGRAEAAAQAPLVVVLDGVTDPQNLGALVRSAYVLGAHGVVVPKDRSAAITPAAAKAAAGATELLPVAQVTNLVRAMEELKERGVWLVAAVAPGQGGLPPWELDLAQPIALCLGSEGQGLRPLVRKTCELRVEIPMRGGLHGASLNVATAGALLLYEALRQRQPATRSARAERPEQPAEQDAP